MTTDTKIAVDALGETPVVDVEGRERKLGSAWSERTALLVFVRHFGWLFCREEAAQLRRVLPEIRSAGAELVVVGSGRPEHARDFIATTGLEATVLCDRSLDAYRLAGLKRGVLRVLNPLVGVNAVRSLVRGFTPRAVQGDPYQLGGVLVITPARRVVYHHAASMAGEALPIDALLAAVRGAAAPAAGWRPVSELLFWRRRTTWMSINTAPKSGVPKSGRPPVEQPPAPPPFEPSLPLPTSVATPVPCRLRMKGEDWLNPSCVNERVATLRPTVDGSNRIKRLVLAPAATDVE